ncbi:hypothetical protein KEQ76_20360, partial [Escherichia coli]|nr:hypothetical protein [Escherichia coli]MDY9248904.1 hypothetical protein [Escherichia coli]MDY9406536.1 hypothetical protein [Escherichia coli]
TSPHRVCGGLSPLSRSSATTVEEQRQSRRYAPCPAHKQKSRSDKLRLFEIYRMIMSSGL